MKKKNTSDVRVKIVTHSEQFKLLFSEHSRRLRLITDDLAEKMGRMMNQTFEVCERTDEHGRCFKLERDVNRGPVLKGRFVICSIYIGCVSGVLRAKYHAPSDIDKGMEEYVFERLSDALAQFARRNYLREVVIFTANEYR